MKICLVGSSGGHLTHLLMLKKYWEKHDRFWVTFDKVDSVSQLQNEKKYWCFYPTNRNIINLIRNTFLAFKLIRKEKPDVIISSGAGVAIPFFIFGRLFRKKTIFIEVFDRIDKPTLTGKIVKPFTNLFIVQCEEQEKKFKKSINLGSIF